MSAGTGYFPTPVPPAKPMLYLHHHTHELIEAGAHVNPNGTWNALYECRLCPDIVIGGHVGPIPAGYCNCGWVQRKPGRKKCENCKQTMDVGQ